MGCRGQILIEDIGVYLYTHWGADSMVNNLKRTLAMKGVRGRWVDDEYLARIIFSQMVKNDIDGTTGYGIGSSEHGDIEKLITINCEKQTIKVRYIYDDVTREYTSFEEFINDFDFEIDIDD